MKLCPHIINGSATARRIALEGRSPAVKLVRAYDKGAEFKAAGCIVVARHPLDYDSQWREFIARPGDYYQRFLRPHLAHPANAAVEYWETGVNEDGPRKLEGAETPDPGDMALRAAFETDVARLINADGRKPIVGNFAVGNPSGERDEQRAAWRAYLPALRAAQALGGYVGVHAYANIPGWEHPLDTLFDVCDGDGLATLRVFVGETGLEPGWRGWTEEGDYARRMVEWDRAITARYGSRIAAAAVYQFGDSGAQWGPYNLDGAERFADIVIAHGQATNAPPTPPPVEKPLFSFPGAGMLMFLYNRPAGDIVGTRFANWQVDVYETRAEWWRVTRGASGRWVRMSFA